MGDGSELGVWVSVDAVVGPGCLRGFCEWPRAVLAAFYMLTDGFRANCEVGGPKAPLSFPNVLHD